MIVGPEKLGGEHDVTGFDSQVGPLDRWLKSSAHACASLGTATTYVLHNGGEVHGYYTLSNYVVDLSHAPPARLMKSRQQLPAILLGKLAVDHRYQGQRLGSRLLVHAYGMALQAANISAARALIIDAKDEPAARFYEHHDCQRFDPQAVGSQKMYILFDTIRAMLRG